MRVKSLSKTSPRRTITGVLKLEDFQRVYDIYTKIYGVIVLIHSPRGK